MITNIVLYKSFTIILQIYMLINCSVSTATDYGPEGRGSIPGRGKRIFSSSQRPERFCGSPGLLQNEYWGLVPWGYSGRGVILQSYPSNAEVKYGGAMPPLPLHAFTVWCLIKHTDNVTFTFSYYSWII
jgi:hypothetical protein